MSWYGHWHGYGWTGTPVSYAREGNRRPPYPVPPPPEAKEEDKARYRDAANEFLTSNLPPLMTGHWLLKRNQSAEEFTWTNPESALAWLIKRHQESSPFEHADGKAAYCALEQKLEHAADALPRGVDVSWVHYTRSQTMVSLSVVCCPNRFHPDIPCPFPPS
ncbi:hypothetical protein GCM10010387_19360 [Streptomyces inusitatus]|uniref:Uncharacterized protein n=1 Tax=Streptomyces inusitatus TaxID=68221 RepID=A0A918PZL5_9ACTN|nr:hypothetical protein [Streptomyces inusitatus]GGZ25901.1 hypothetical protein GCM10010387_19360 [Streptomyces inusitatus]